MKAAGVVPGNGLPGGGHESGRPVRVVRNERLGARARRLVLEMADSAPLRWRAGQHVGLRLEERRDALLRYYSIAVGPTLGPTCTLEVAVGAEIGADPVTDRIAGLAPGSPLWLTGPSGQFVRRHLDGRAEVMVGAGTGVAPLRAMIQEALQEPEPVHDLVLVAGFRSIEDMLWVEEFSGLSAVHPRFRFEPVLSRPPTHWKGRRGYVQAHLGELTHPLEKPRFYVCGSDPMVRDTRSRLRRLGFPEESLFSESY